MRLRIKGATRKLLAPFRKYEQRLKRAGQRFVLKTIELHRPHVESHPVVVASATGGDSMLSSSMLLPLLRASRRSEDFRTASWQALQVGNYLLTTHPRAGIAYHLPEDLAETAWIVQGDYQPEVTAWLCARLTSGQRIVYCGAGSGYHALTAALQVGSAGKMLAFCDTEAQQEVLQLNLEVHGLAANVSISTSLPKSTELHGLSASSQPAVWLINAQSPRVDEYRQLASGAIGQVYMVEAHQVRASQSHVEASNPELKLLRKVA